MSIKRFLLIVPAVAVLAFALSACTDVPTVSTGQAESLPSRIQLGEAQPTEPNPVNGDPVPLGTTQSLEVTGGTVDVTVYGVKPGVVGGSAVPPVGSRHTGLDVQVCTSFATETGAQDRWSLSDASNGRYAPQMLAADQFQPEYPYFKVAWPAGDCLRGWVMFETVDATPVTVARYSGSEGDVLRWSLS